MVQKARAHQVLVSCGNMQMITLLSLWSRQGQVLLGAVNNLFPLLPDAQ